MILTANRLTKIVKSDGFLDHCPSFKPFVQQYRGYLNNVRRTQRGTCAACQNIPKPLFARVSVQLQRSEVMRSELKAFLNSEQLELLVPGQQVTV